MSSKKHETRVSSGKTKKDGNSHHDDRVSPNAKSDTRPKTFYPRGKSTTAQQSRPKSADTRQARGSLEGDNPVYVSICDTKKGALKNEKAEWKTEKAELEKCECEKLREKIKELKQSLSKEKEDNKTLQKDYDQLEQDLQREHNKSKTEWDKHCKKLTIKHTNEKEQLLNTIESLTVEKENLLTRLSTISADRLMHGNVNIVDLSDADRPTKLSEVYSELYDNEWTDAFEELTSVQKISDKDAIVMLLKILMSSFQNCREITWGRYERLLHVASSIDIEQRNSMSSDKKVMSIVSKPSLTTQEAQPSRVQLDKNDNKEDQNGSNKNVEMADPGMNAASQDEFANEKEKKFAMDKNMDMAKEGTASSEGGEKKEMQIDEKENKEHDGKEIVKSGDPEESGASKDKSENINGKVNVESDGKENEESAYPIMSGASKDKSKNNGAKENMESGDTNVNGASNDKLENKNGKNGAKENMESGDTNVNGASNDKLENKNGKRLKHTIELDLDLILGLKGIWRKTTLELREILVGPIYSVIETCLDMPVSVLPMTSEYLKRCIDLCWKMGVQEKPLYLGSIAEMDAYVGKKFDKDEFRAYTQSGRNVAFVVWPSLYLYEGGPMLVKGIAQGCSSEENRNT